MIKDTTYKQKHITNTDRQAKYTNAAYTNIKHNDK